MAGANLSFIDVSTGWPGSIHAARVLRLSGIFRKAEDGHILSEPVRIINGSNVRPLILGDPAYPLLPWLMTAYPATRLLTPAQQRFNNQLSKARVVVQCAFGRAKGRWRCLLSSLKNPQVVFQKSFPLGCILHNICILIDDDIEYTDDDDDNDGNIAPAGAGADAATAVRQATTDYL